VRHGIIDLRARREARLGAKGRTRKAGGDHRPAHGIGQGGAPLKGCGQLAD
jgi:hypothetical protein